MITCKHVCNCNTIYNTKKKWIEAASIKSFPCSNRPKLLNRQQVCTITCIARRNMQIKYAQLKIKA
jgi:hypothetical protein